MLYARAEFGCVTNDKQFTVDTGAGLVIRVNRHNGSVPSIIWNGVELNDAKRASCINSGLADVETSSKVDTKSGVVVIEVKTSPTSRVAADMTHYYIVKKNEPILYMATYAGKQPAVGELRWITRLKGSLFDQVPEPSSTRGCVGHVESDDISRAKDNTTRSKFYGNERAIDLTIRGVRGDLGGVYMAYGSRESSSGGPFFRDIQNQSGECTEVYNYMNSGHAQTEHYRTGVLHGPYALLFTRGPAPRIPSMDFIESLNLRGYVKKQGRGRVIVDAIDNMHPKTSYTLGFTRQQAQYWCRVSATQPAATSPWMKPGIYTMTLYQGELAVHTEEVEVTAQKNTTIVNITPSEDPSRRKALWRIGQWDGMPCEFTNGNGLTIAHPADARMKTWKRGAYDVKTSPPNEFPACIWRDVNNSTKITFSLADQPLQPRKLRIGITSSHSGGRPVVKINDWSSRATPAPPRMRSRALTIGTYRGTNQTFEFDVPASALRKKENEIKIEIISGSGGGGFLSPGISIDCIDFCE